MFIRFEQEMSEQVKIVKVGAEEPTGGSKPKAVKTVKTANAANTAKKSMRTYPRGVLKGGKTAKAKTTIQGVRDPAKAPPVQKSRKSTLRILTEKGAEKRRRKIKHTVRSMPDGKVRNLLRASGLPVSEKTPTHIAKEILEGGMEAGLIVAK